MTAPAPGPSTTPAAPALPSAASPVTENRRGLDTGQGRLVPTAGGEVAAPASENEDGSAGHAVRVGARPAKVPPLAARSGASPPVPHDPDRAITDWWWDDEPDPRVPLRHVAGWLVLAAALWALLILVGYDVWYYLRLGISWAA